MGPLAEKIVVARIIPPHLRETKIDLSKSSLEDLECWKCNSRVFNYICSALSDDVLEFIYDKLEIMHTSFGKSLEKNMKSPNGLIKSNPWRRHLRRAICLHSTLLSLKCHLSSKEREVKTLSL
jgi:hypothetical protein